MLKDSLLRRCIYLRAFIGIGIQDTYGISLTYFFAVDVLGPCNKFSLHLFISKKMSLQVSPN